MMSGTRQYRVVRQYLSALPVSTFKTIGSAGTDRDAFIVAVGTNDSRAYTARYNWQTNTWGSFVQKGDRTWTNLSGFNFSEIGPTG
jgi:hypothetical protein